MTVFEFVSNESEIANSNWQLCVLYRWVFGQANIEHSTERGNAKEEESVEGKSEKDWKTTTKQK